VFRIRIESWFSWSGAWSRKAKIKKLPQKIKEQRNIFLFYYFLLNSNISHQKLGPGSVSVLGFTINPGSGFNENLTGMDPQHCFWHVGKFFFLTLSSVLFQTPRTFGLCSLQWRTRFFSWTWKNTTWSSPPLFFTIFPSLLILLFLFVCLCPNPGPPSEN
jgi:hypothetical protein